MILTPIRQGKHFIEYEIGTGKAAIWSPYERSKDLLACSCNNGVLVLRRSNNEGYSKVSLKATPFLSRWNLQNFKELTFGVNVWAIAFSPACTESELCLAAACSDNSLRLVKGDQTITLGGISGHRSHVRAIDVTEVAEGTIVASTGDDRCLIIWEDTLPTAITLMHPGVSLQFSKHLPQQILVGEEYGAIRLYDWTAQSCLYSIHTGAIKTSSDVICNAQWLSRSYITAATRGGSWMIWDVDTISGSARTLTSTDGHVDERLRAGVASFNAKQEVFAVGGVNSVFVFNLAFNNKAKKLEIPSIGDNHVASLSFHSQEGVLSISYSNKVMLVRAISNEQDLVDTAGWKNDTEMEE